MSADIKTQSKSEILGEVDQVVRAMTWDELFATYNGQCRLTDELAAKLEAGSDKALLARIAELESDLATMNKRYSTVLEAAPASSAMAMQADAARFVFEHTEFDAILKIEFEHINTPGKTDINWWRDKIDAAMQSQQSPVQASDAGRQG